MGSSGKSILYLKLSGWTIISSLGTWLLSLWLLLLRDYQKIVYEPFIDYESGEVKEGAQYFNPLSRTILQYIEHLENKLEGERGVLERKQIQANGLFTSEMKPITLKISL